MMSGIVDISARKKLLTASAMALFAFPWMECASAQDLPPDLAITEPAPDSTAATPLVPPAENAVPVPVPANPAAGVPADSAPAGNVAEQSSSGTYETLDPAAFAKLETAMNSMSVLRKNIVRPEDLGTLVFTLWQHSLLQDAKRLFRTRRPTEGEIASATDGSAVDEMRPRGVRELSLSGILYKGKDDWIVWLNGKRLAPDALPKEIIDIKVTETHIDLKWFDAYTNLIYPIRMRPHQRFNLDTRIFLPGITADAAAQLQAASTGQ